MRPLFCLHTNYARRLFIFRILSTDLVADLYEKK